MPPASSNTADVVVLGGGIIGMAIARELAAAGVDVLVVEEQEAPGLGTSGRCDGNVLLQTKDDQTLVELTRRSIATYRSWSQQLELDIRFEQSGSLVFMTVPEQMAIAEQRLIRMRSQGISADSIDNGQLKELEPNLRGEFAGAILCHDDAEVYPPAVVAALVLDARRHGCRIMCGAAAQEVVTDRAGAVAGVRTSEGLISSRVVVNALGAWAPLVSIPGMVPTMPVRPRQGVLVVTEERPGLVRHNMREASYISDRVGHDESGAPHVAFAVEPTYRGNLLIGSSRQFTGFNTDVTFAVLASIMARATSFLPELRNTHVIRTFAGLRPWTPDNRPIIGMSRRVPGLVIAAGHEGEGIGMAPATADLVVAVVLGRSVDELQQRALDELSPDRFSYADASWWSEANVNGAVERTTRRSGPATHHTSAKG